MRTCPSILLIVILLGPATAWSQTHVVFHGLGTQPSRISDFDLTTTQLNWEMPREFPLHNWLLFRAPAITGDGRFALWPAVNLGLVGGFVVRDLITDAMTAGVLPPSLISTFDSATIVLAHPRHLVMYLLVPSGSILIAEPMGFRHVAGCVRPLAAAITLDGSRLFIACDDKRILVIDTVSESIIREFSLPNETRHLQVNHDGSRLATLDFAGAALRDGNSGELLALGRGYPGTS